MQDNSTFQAFSHFSPLAIGVYSILAGISDTNAPSFGESHGYLVDLAMKSGFLELSALTSPFLGEH